jgi:hypothetical protein
VFFLKKHRDKMTTLSRVPQLLRLRMRLCAQQRYHMNDPTASTAVAGQTTATSNGEESVAVEQQLPNSKPARTNKFMAIRSDILEAATGQVPGMCVRTN